MTTHVLPAPTLISALMPSGGGSLESGDTIELSGHDLIIDTDAVSYPITLSNSSATAHMEMRNGGRIRLNATLPSLICPWVDPENPLPESNYAAGLSGNASAEIQLVGNISLGGGPSSLPTATRPGNFWALCASTPSSSSAQITFDRDFPLHAGDIVFNANGRTNNLYNLCTVVAYDAQTRTATLDKSSFSHTVGNLWGLLAGGVFITRVSPSPDVTRSSICLNAPCRAGTLNFYSNFYGGNNGSGAMAGTNSSLICDRVSYKMQCGTALGYNGLFGGGATCYAREILADILCASATSFPGIPYIHAGELATVFTNNVFCSLRADSGFVYTVNNIVGRNIIANTVNPIRHGISRLVNSFVANNPVDDTQFEISGTVTRVARTSFPVDTDLPDAFYHAPATEADTAWRYEAYWVRKGETLRLSCRAMRGGDTSSARVAIGEMSVWVPAEGMPTLAEWLCDGGQALEWQGGSLEWTNNTGEDCQVRVWSMATGANGAYLRVWRATGGAM